MPRSRARFSSIILTDTQKARWSGYLYGAMLLVCAALWGFLMIYDYVPLIGYVGLFLLGAGNALICRRLPRSTPLDVNILALLLLLPVSLALSHNRELSLVKVHGVLLSIALFCILVNFLANLKRLKWAILALAATAVLLSVLGFFGADWSSGDWALPAKLLASLPLPLTAIHQFTASGGIHVNTIGGTLALFAPLLISLLLDRGAYRRAFLRKHPRAKLFTILYKFMIAAGTALVFFMLILTQSRGALLGTMCGMFILLVWKDRRFLFIIPILVVALLVGIWVFADGDPARFFLLLDTYSNPEGNTLQIRVEYWKNTLYLIQDLPITGAGIGTYGKVFHDIYPFATPLAIVRPLFYAHNMYLAVAADMGLPALVIYLALFSSFFTMTLMAIRKARSIVKTLLRGLLCGMSAHMVYGLMDNYMLGEKLGFSVWLFFAVCTAIYIHRETLVHYYSEQPGEALNTTPRLFRQVARSRLRDLWWNVGAWLVISVIGISFILPHPLISLVITVSGGTLLGIVMTRRFELQYQGEHARPEARTSP